MELNYINHDHLFLTTSENVTNKLGLPEPIMHIIFERLLETNPKSLLNARATCKKAQTAVDAFLLPKFTDTVKSIENTRYLTHQPLQSLYEKFLPYYNAQTHQKVTYALFKNPDLYSPISKSLIYKKEYDWFTAITTNPKPNLIIIFQNLNDADISDIDRLFDLSNALMNYIQTNTPIDPSVTKQIIDTFTSYANQPPSNNPTVKANIENVAQLYLPTAQTLHYYNLLKIKALQSPKMDSQS